MRLNTAKLGWKTMLPGRSNEHLGMFVCPTLLMAIAFGRPAGRKTFCAIMTCFHPPILATAIWGPFEVILRLTYGLTDMTGEVCKLVWQSVCCPPRPCHDYWRLSTDKMRFRRARNDFFARISSANSDDL